MREGLKPNEVDAFRFWVGTENERWSSVWKIWEKNAQVYVLSTALAGTSKLSLHSPEECQIGFDKHFRDKRSYGHELAGFPTFIRWKRHQVNEGQAVPLAFVRFPTDFMRVREPSPAPRPGKFQCGFRLAPSGQCVELFFMAISRPRRIDGLDCEGPYKLLCWMPLGQDELCVVLAKHCEFAPEQLPIGKQIELPDEWMNPPARNLAPGQALKNKNLQLWNHPNDFEPIHITELTGMTLTKNASRILPK